jgi:hypothetical protein
MNTNSMKSNGVSEARDEGLEGKQRELRRKELFERQHMFLSVLALVRGDLWAWKRLQRVRQNEVLVEPRREKFELESKVRDLKAKATEERQRRRPRRRNGVFQVC